jgi:hypothetical protein
LRQHQWQRVTSGGWAATLVVLGIVLSAVNSIAQILDFPAWATPPGRPLERTVAWYQPLLQVVAELMVKIARTSTLLKPL